MNKKIGLIVVSIVVLLVLAGAGYYYISKGKQPKGGVEEVAPSEFDLGVDLGEGLDLGEIGKATENPLKNMPPINPLEDVANPFKDGYKNPFK